MAGTETGTVRSPDQTRSDLLAAAFEEMFRSGFQAASLSRILSNAGLTKGALYHHFEDKAALGVAVIDELVRGPILDAYLGPLAGEVDDPLGAIQSVLRRRADDFDAGGIELGCPLNNLAQEMSPLDERFRERIREALDLWVDGFADVLERGQRAGTVRADVDPRRVAGLVVAAIEGSFGMAKSAQSAEVLRSNLEVLADLLEGLRAGLAPVPG